jgi:hypothetical protein
MTRYYFDLEEDGGTAIDEEGLELSTMQRVQEEAARSLADMARDTVAKLDGGTPYEMTVAVRDDVGPVLRVSGKFEIDRLRKQ